MAATTWPEAFVLTAVGLGAMAYLAFLAWLDSKEK